MARNNLLCADVPLRNYSLTKGKCHASRTRQLNFDNIKKYYSLPVDKLLPENVSESLDRAVD